MQARTSTVLFTRQGQLFVSGPKAYNLGTELSCGVNTFVEVPLPTKFVSVSAGKTFTLGVSHDGSLWYWGLLPGGSIQWTPTQFPDLDCFVSVAMGGEHGMAHDSKGQVWVIGHNYAGQLGLDSSSDVITVPTQIPSLQNIIKITAGMRHSLCLDSTGKVWSWGSNNKVRISHIQMYCFCILCIH
jgi:alpha-tubulin suppressor-like RCC1 family protein